MGRIQFAKVSSQIFRSFWHIGCKAVECLKGSKEPVKVWLLLGRETELEDGPSRHIETCPVAASSGHVQQVIRVFWHCGCQTSTSPGLWRGTHTSKTADPQIHTQKVFLSLARLMNTLKLKKNCPSFCTVPTLTPPSFLLSCTTLSTKQCFYHHLTTVSSWS